MPYWSKRNGGSYLPLSTLMVVLLSTSSLVDALPVSSTVTSSVLSSTSGSFASMASITSRASSTTALDTSLPVSTLSSFISPSSTGPWASSGIAISSSSSSSPAALHAAATSSPLSASTGSVPASSASAQPTVLAFELAATTPPSTIHSGTPVPSSTAAIAAAGLSNSSTPTFYVAYENAWTSTIDNLQVSLPNVSTIRGDSVGTTSQDLSAQGVISIPHPHRNGNSSLTYRLFFPPDFDFSNDARLPSIYSGRMGCANCFSTRVRYNPDGTGELYMYNPTQRQADSLCSIPSSTCNAKGLHIGRGAWTFPKGKWMTIRQDIWLNTPGQSDGGFNIWLDGHLVLSAKTVRYTDRGNQCPLNGMSIRRPGNEMFDACLPSPRARWVYSPAARRRVYTPMPIPVKEVVTRVITQTIIPPKATITQNVPVTVTKAIIQTQINQVTVPVPTTIMVTQTETATATRTITEEPVPTDPPVEEIPVEDPPAEEEPPAEDEGDADEEAIPVAKHLPRGGIVDKRDDGMWKGLNGYPGDPGYEGGAIPAPVVNGFPFTFTVQQVVTLPGPFATVTVTKTAPVKPTKAAPKKKPA